MKKDSFHWRFHYFHSTHYFQHISKIYSSLYSFLIFYFSSNQVIFIFSPSFHIILFIFPLETRDEKMKTVSFDSKTIFEDSGKMNKDDIRRVTVFLVYILTSFFGVGNIARYFIRIFVQNYHFCPK